MKQSKILFLFIFSLFFIKKLDAQQIIGIGATYDDSFREWSIATEDEEFEANFRQRWQLDNNWLEWDVNWGDYDGTIRQKWKNDPNQWELRLNGEIVTIKTHWKNDFNEWLISDGRQEIILETKYTGMSEEWLLKKNTYGAFNVSMYYENDPRDWVITDKLNDEINIGIKLATIFVVVFQSSPKR